MNQHQVNSNLSGVGGAFKAFQAMDYPALQEKELELRIQFYVAREGMNCGLNAAYVGEVSALSGNIITLPRPKYTESIKPQGRAEFKGERVPLSASMITPQRLEFVIGARSAASYDGLRSFVDTAIPELFRNGYTQYNTDHSSVAWFSVVEAAGPKTIWYIGPEGLRIHNEALLDGRRALGHFDVKRLMDLSN